MQNTRAKSPNRGYSTLEPQNSNGLNSSFIEQKMNVRSNVTGYVDHMWKKYDEDNNGYLDMSEARKFIYAVFSDMFEAESLNILKGDGFKKIFEKLDTDGNGTIDKDEAIAFIKALNG